MTDAIDIRYQPAGGPLRKVSFRPRSDGGWLRVTLEWNGCQWRETGCESVDEVALECTGGVAIGE
ncbi:hypothetical protein GS429_08485 [Natronorubrum sp. JWXQ-INN-674]|uniref:Uncharacterized protein n=1 Tax=Natronorubrum halalkaliphilum TaxID=2691917 RepID=A0A6B0VLY9_9EURY|nr:hypothetical protein [Natronorubrum halalkaliphilum]MXV62097.1 hypothetical protein [Natronorubrum halalkaliphilum]